MAADIDGITSLASGEDTEATVAAGMEGERVRTALNYFLQREIDSAAARERGGLVPCR